MEDASVDAVTSNCVINLVPDKAAVFREVARVLRPGGRVVVVGHRPRAPAARGGGEGRARLVRLRGRRRAAPRLLPRWSRRPGSRDVSVLKEEDYAAVAGRDRVRRGPDASLERSGVQREELLGDRPMSVTWRAVKALSRAAGAAGPGRRGAGL